MVSESQVDAELEAELNSFN